MGSWLKAITQRGTSCLRMEGQTTGPVHPWRAMSGESALLKTATTQQQDQPREHKTGECCLLACRKGLTDVSHLACGELFNSGNKRV